MVWARKILVPTTIVRAMLRCGGGAIFASKVESAENGACTYEDKHKIHINTNDNSE